MSDFIGQLSEFSARARRLLNTYPFEARMSEQSMAEFNDKFCVSPNASVEKNSLMGIPVITSSLVPDHEVWWVYHDERVEGGLRVEKMTWGDT